MHEAENHGTLVDCLFHAVQVAPEKTAFLDATQSLDFQTLLCQAQQVAAALIDQGIGAGDRVAIILPRCLDIPVAVYGVWLSGAAYVPIDPATPSSYQASIMMHCEVSALISSPKLQVRMSATLAEPGLNLRLVLGVESAGTVPSKNWLQVRQQSVPQSLPELSPQSLAFILHTSGSTGKPKGIMHTHASALAYTTLAAQACDITSTDVIACHSALHTDMSTLGLFAAPLTQASALIIPDAHIRMPASLSSLLQAAGASVWYSVPLALVQLLQHGVLEKRNLAALRLVIYAGEALSPLHLKQLMLHWPQARFSNHYGPAETNVCTSFNLPTDALASGYIDTGKAIPIGTSWGSNHLLLADANLAPVAAGDSGEILVHSTTTMTGYWKAPELSAQSLVQLKTADGEKTFYRTGDIAEYDTAGNLRLIGRKDRQVKVRGYRIELDAIEHLLTQCEAVKQNAVFTRKTDETLQIHIAFIPSLPTNNKNDVADYCQHNLYQGALPLDIHLVESFPTTTTGKVDRRALADQIFQSN